MRGDGAGGGGGGHNKWIKDYRELKISKPSSR